jgi:oxazoline/thiazoline synthase
MVENQHSLIDGNEKLVWNPCYAVATIEDEGIFLVSERDKIFLRGKIYLSLSPFLNEQKYSADELASFLSNQIPAEVLYYALSRLEQKQFIQAKADLLPPQIAAFCGLVNVSEKEAFDRLSSTKVFLQSFGEAIDPELTSLLTSLQIELVDTSDRADFSVVIAKDYLQQELFEFNRSAFSRNHPWLLAKPAGSQIWIGPFFHPEKKTGCYECLALRLKANRLEESYIQKKKGLKAFFSPSHAMLASGQKMAWNLVATEIFKRIVLRESAALEGKLITFDSVDLRLQDHYLTKQHRCPCCGDRSNEGQELSPLILTAKKKRGSGVESYRDLAPEETLKKYSSHISPITGVVEFLEPLSNSLGPAIHVYHGGSNRALPSEYKGQWIKSFRNFSGGKGTTDSVAKAGCLCESIERTSGEFRGDEIRIQTSFHQLRNDAVHPQHVLLFSDQQYLNQKSANPDAHRFHKVPVPFSEDAIIDWTPVWSMTEQRYKYYPTTCCYYSYPREEKKWACASDSNGCAAGNCLEEAILQGFFELVERDSIAVWWYNRLKRPFLDLASFQIPYIASFLEEYERVGREVWVLDITTDLGIPTFAAISRLKEKGDEKIFFGFGAHLDAPIALVRALTEMNQFLSSQPFWEDSVYEHQDIIDNKIVREWMSQATVENQPYLKGSSLKSAEDFEKVNTLDLLQDIQRCQKIVESQGMEFLVLDQTRPEIGLTVVKVIVPGLRHFWPRFASGRLYDVPVKMKWLKEPLKECDLNPIGIFI